MAKFPRFLTLPIAAALIASEPAGGQHRGRQLGRSRRQRIHHRDVPVGRQRGDCLPGRS